MPATGRSPMVAEPPLVQATLVAMAKSDEVEQRRQTYTVKNEELDDVGYSDVLIDSVHEWTAGNVLMEPVWQPSRRSRRPLPPCLGRSQPALDPQRPDRDLPRLRPIMERDRGGARDEPTGCPQEIRVTRRQRSFANGAATCEEVLANRRYGLIQLLGNGPAILRVWQRMSPGSHSSDPAAGRTNSWPS